jgi:hypothetical protein
MPGSLSGLAVIIIGLDIALWLFKGEKETVR